MELTKNQIHKVEQYLKHKNFDFVDLKIEVLDHIISDIEMKMSKSFSFENAFKMHLLNNQILVKKVVESKNLVASIDPASSDVYIIAVLTPFHESNGQVSP